MQHYVLFLSANIAAFSQQQLACQQICRMLFVRTLIKMFRTLAECENIVLPVQYILLDIKLEVSMIYIYMNYIKAEGSGPLMFLDFFFLSRIDTTKFFQKTKQNTTSLLNCKVWPSLVWFPVIFMLPAKAELTVPPNI